jgi:hypothetical protein
VEAGIQLAQNIGSDAPDPALPVGEEADAELAALCDALKRENPRQAERLDEIARIRRAQAGLGEHQGEHTEKIKALLLAGLAGWANDLEGEFAGRKDRAILVQVWNGIPIVDGEGNHFIGPKRPTSPHSATVDDFIRHLKNENVEGFFDFMYKDSGDNVTIGIGKNLTGNGGADEAVKLLTGKAFSISTKEFSSGQQIREAYTTVLNSPLKNTGGTPEEARQFSPLTDVRILEADAGTLAVSHFQQERGKSKSMDSRDHYPDFDHVPKGAQLVAFDIIYNTNGAKFDEFEKFKKAYNRRDWAQANIEQRGKNRGNNKARMAIIGRHLQSASELHPFFIDFDAKPGQGIDIEGIDCP